MTTISDKLISSLKRSPWLWATAGVLGVYFAVRYALMPPALDDAVYLHRISNRAADGSFVIDWTRLFEIFDIYFWSPRLSNVVIPIFLSIPMWLKGAIGGVLQACTLMLGARMAGLTQRNSLTLCSLMAVMYIALLPWYDSLTVCAYMTNYCIPTVLMMGLYTIFVRERPVAWWNAMLYAIFFAFWHEGFTACAMCACWFTLALHRKMWRTDRIVTATVLTAVTLLYWNLPATHIRLVEDTSIYGSLLVFMSVGIELFIAVWLVCTARRRWHHIVVSPILTIMLGTAIASYVVMWILRISARSAFPGMVCSVFGLLYIINCLSAGRHAGRAMKCVAGAVWLGLLVQFGYVVYYDYITFRESDYIMKEFKSHPDRQIFAPLRHLTPHPAWTLRQNNPIWTLNSFSRQTNSLFVSDTKGYIKVAPIELRDYHTGAGTQVESNIALRYYHGQYVCSIGELNGGLWKIYTRMTFHNGVKYRSSAYLESFHSSDGSEYLWVYPNGRWLEYICGPVVRIDFDIE